MPCQDESHYPDPDVLIVGGGPVGMLCAAELADYGVSVMLTEPRTGSDRRPRAGTIHSRTLSLLARRGYLRESDSATQEGEVRTGFQFAGRPVLEITAPAVEPGPIAGIPQWRLEELFEDLAIRRGANVRRGTRAVDIDASASRPRVRIETEEGRPEQLQVPWVIGADGARSLVAGRGDFHRVEYPATMQAISGLARPVRGESLPHGWHQTPRGWLMSNPAGTDPWRIIPMDFTGPAADRRKAPTVSEYRALLDAVLARPVQISDIHALTRFSDYGRYHETMREGRLMIVGDAAHVHYPLGGQGLNVGIHDAISLCWRLADVVRGHAPATVLDDFSNERTEVAADVVANTVLQAQMMNPERSQLTRAVNHLIGGADLQRLMGEMVSQQRQPVAFQPDLRVSSPGQPETTLVRLLREGRHVALRRADARGADTPHGLGQLPPQTRVVVADLTPPPIWQAALVRPDGYIDRLN
ncbi:MAG: FAD-dependent monooxygenase [Nocardioides sp.]|uniref:FAD-dependent monooxygenase n=1 Tax=Nocardioides sp. TaxID=35761 RepID=UPI003D6A4379